MNVRQRADDKPTAELQKDNPHRVEGALVPVVLRSSIGNMRSSLHGGHVPGRSDLSMLREPSSTRRYPTVLQILH